MKLSTILILSLEAAAIRAATPSYCFVSTSNPAGLCYQTDDTGAFTNTVQACSTQSKCTRPCSPQPGALKPTCDTTAECTLGGGGAAVGVANAGYQAQCAAPA